MSTHSNSNLALQLLSKPQLLLNFAALVRVERKVSREVLQHIAEIERRRLYADEGFSSTHDWLVSRHRYSHASAGRRVSAAKLLCAIPEAAVKIETGELCMTSLSRIQSAIRCEEKRSGEVMTISRKNEVLSEIETQPKAQIERSLAELFHVSAPLKEIIQQKCDGEIRTHLTFTDEQMRRIDRARELLSHKLENASLADAIAAMADLVIAAKDPLSKIVRPRINKSARERQNNAMQSRSGVAGSPPTRESSPPTGKILPQTRKLSSPARERTSPAHAVSPSTLNSVYRRDDGCCQFKTPDGVKCQSRRFTQIDHVIPRALGGTNALNNLRVLCRTHNLLMAERIFGSEKVRARKSKLAREPAFKNKL